MNRASAQAYTSSLQHIFAGREYRRTLNVYATRYFLESIHRDFGRRGLRKAVESVKRHLEYYSGIGKSSLPSTRAILTEFATIVDIAVTEENLQARFYDEVRKSMADSGQSRRGVWGQCIFARINERLLGVCKRQVDGGSEPIRRVASASG
ncbi:MAG: hypothetical protein WD049_10180 [Candidatus Paceibacterota bacterium]